MTPAAPPPAVAVRTVDFAMRLMFFATAPFVLFGIAAYFPIAGAFVNIGIVLVVFFSAEAIRQRAERWKWLSKVLRRQLAFDEYYRAHPPRAFLYYVFYPLLFPYWLFNREARREFVLFKGYTLVSMALLVGGSIWQYFTKWLPELHFDDFIGVLIATLVVEALVVLGALMPFATTVIAYHQAGKRRRLVVLLLAAVASLAFAGVVYAKKRHSVAPFPTSIRLTKRTHANPKKSRAVREEALHRAYKLVRKGIGEFEHDEAREAEVLGQPLDAARASLGKFYKDDETYLFHLVTINSKDKGQMLVLYGDTERKGAKPIWLGIHAKGSGSSVFDDMNQLPLHAFDLMRRNSRR